MDALTKRERNRAYYQENKAKWKVYQARQKERSLFDPEYAARKRRNLAAARRRLREKVNAIKLESGCVDCGYNRSAAALVFDHVCGEKITEVATLVADRRPWSVIEAEIAKCEVRCANCHCERTWTP